MSGHEGTEEECICGGFETITCPECGDVDEDRDDCARCNGNGEVSCPECT